MKISTLWLGFFLVIGLAQPLTTFSEEMAEPSDDGVVKMSLADAISLALRTNRSVQMAYLDRTVQKFDLKVAEDKFFPDVNFDGSISRTETDDDTRQGQDKIGTDTLTDEISGSLRVSETVPTGGAFQFIWNPGRNDFESDDFQSGSGLSRQRSEGYTSSWNVSFTQPLLKGGGINISTASVTQARLTEQANILNLKSTLINTVTSVINAYRAFQQARGQVEISKASLARARKLVEINKLMIESGRMAEVEMVQSEAEVASREFSYEGALNNFDRARLALIKVLDIPKNTRFNLTGEGELKRIVPDPDTCTDTAFDNRPDYLQSVLNLEGRKIDLILAKNNRLWDLRLNAAYGASGSRTDQSINGLDDPRRKTDGREWRIGLDLQVPVWGDFTRQQAVLGAETGLRKARISHKELTDNVETEVLDAIRDVAARLKQVDLARLSRDLSEQKLIIEETKLKAGRSTNFQLVSFQNDLVNAQNAELNAITDYRNALSALDQVLGTTLDTWQIVFKSERAEKGNARETVTEKTTTSGR